MTMANSFKAVSENGTIYEIIEYGSTIDVSSHDGRASIPGLGTLATSTGLTVNDQGDGTFKIVQTGEVLRKID